ncbi:MAG: 3-methyl-2-oxobutanoate hydroxymethyltransferase [Bacteriovoracaceae bacterium]|nr:3-methyl-2-oxobutanoate hydroxymethyltransferase [Bacteriovoracaceae bacterium]
MKKHTTRDIRGLKGKKAQMLTCYDYQTACLLNETDVDMLLVGDSLGNVILGFDTTVLVTPSMMSLFGQAVRRGAPDKFLIIDMPFGSYATINQGLRVGTKLFQACNAEAVKLEGAHATELQTIKRLTEVGVAVMGHIGLTPQSVHQMGGYFTHGKKADRAKELKEEALRLQDAGCFSLVLECITPELSKEITESLEIPTIGIGSGMDVDAQVLVTNDLLKMGPKEPPKFVKPIADLYGMKKKLIEKYLKENRA